MKEAQEMSRKQRAAHNALTATFDTDVVQEWTDMVLQWQQHPDKPDPFEEVDISTHALPTGKMCLSNHIAQKLVKTTCSAI